MSPLLQAALFYVQTAAGDLAAAQREISDLRAARAQVTLRAGEARARLEAFIAGRARAGRGIPAAPHAGKIPGAVTADGIAQAPDRPLISLLAGVAGGLWYHQARLVAAGDCRPPLSVSVVGLVASLLVSVFFVVVLVAAGWRATTP